MLLLTPIRFTKAEPVGQYPGALLASLLLVLFACTPQEPLRIGFLGGLSGRVADLGIGGRNGAMLAVELRNQSYSKSWVGDFRKAFDAMGGHIAGELALDADDSLSSLAARALSRKPDGVIIVANSVDIALLAQHIRMRDARVRLGTAEWAATERLVELGGKAVEGLVVPQYVDRDSNSSGYLAFRRAYRERFGSEPGFPGLTAFDATNVALDALAGKSAGQTLKQAILAHGSFAGAQSQIRFDTNGDTLRDTFLAVIRNGEFVSLPPAPVSRRSGSRPDGSGP